jgi:hypothetical protein
MESDLNIPMALGRFFHSSENKSTLCHRWVSKNDAALIEAFGKSIPCWLFSIQPD